MQDMHLAFNYIGKHLETSKKGGCPIRLGINPSVLYILVLTIALNYVEQ